MYRALIGAVGACLLVGCAAPPEESGSNDQSIVITKFAKGTDFGDYQTYYLRPEILTLNEDGDHEPLDEDTAEPLLEATRKNLEARGYVSVAEADRANADIGVQVMYGDQLNTAQWCYYWWDPYYWGYPGWGYYPYYGGCSTTVWKSGMLATVIVDLGVAREDGGDLGQGGAGGSGPNIDQVPGVWFSGVYGAGLTSKEARDGINQAFKQSPYLRAD
jgi:hypothetical protein